MRIPFTRPKEVLLETARSDQADHISDLHALCFDREWGSAEIAGLIRQPNVICIVVKEVGKPKSMPLAFIMTRMAADEAEILTIGVSPTHRREGLAKKLLDETSRRLQGERAKSLFLEVETANEAAVKLYKQMKFEKVAERPAYYQGVDGSRSSALVMRLDLV